MNKVKTRVQVMKIKYILNKTQLIESIGITEDQYADFQFETGIEWIREMLWNDEAAISVISGSSFFWDWFINEWNKRDDDFIIDYFAYVISGKFEKILLQWWQDSHRINKIKDFPQGTAWVKLVNQVIRKAGKEAIC